MITLNRPRWSIGNGVEFSSRIRFFYLFSKSKKRDFLRFYRAMHCKARYCDRMSSVCLSVCSLTLVDCDHMEFFENNFTVS